jgi:hypothetical protein
MRNGYLCEMELESASITRSRNAWFPGEGQGFCTLIDPNPTLISPPQNDKEHKC